MANKCTVCTHPKRDEIDHEIMAGTPMRKIAERYGLSVTAIHRHKEKHLPTQLVKAKQKVEEIRASSLLDKARSILQQAEEITTAAQKSGDYRTALQGIGRIRDVVELLMKVTGELDQRTEINVNLNLEFNHICQVMFKELEPYPEVRMRIADIVSEMKK